MNEPLAQSPFDTFVTEVLNKYAREPFDPAAHHPFHCVDAFSELELPLLTAEQRKAFLTEYRDLWLSVDESEANLPPMAYATAHPVDEESEPVAAGSSQPDDELDVDWEPDGVIAGGNDAIIGTTNLVLGMARAGISLDDEAIPSQQFKSVQHELGAAFFDEGEILHPGTVGNFNWAYSHLRISKLPEGIEGLIPSPILPAGVSLEDGVRDWFDFDITKLPGRIRARLTLLTPSECGLEMLRNGSWKPVTGVPIIGIKAV